MPRRFPKQMWDVRAKLRGTPSYDDPFFQERIRSMSPASALRRVKRNYRPYSSELQWEALPVQGPELPAPLDEIVFEPVVNFKPQQYAVYEIDDDGDELECIFSGTMGSAKKKLGDAIGSDSNKKFHVVAIAYTPRGQLADSEVVWSDLKQELVPAKSESAGEGITSRDVRDDEAFGRMLGERLGDRERFLFGLRRGGVRAKPAYISPTALEELNNVPWRGDYDSYKWLKRNVGFEDPEGYPEDDF